MLLAEKIVYFCTNKCCGVLPWQKSGLCFCALVWFTSSNRKVHVGCSDAVMRIEEALGTLHFKTFVFKIWLQFSSFSLGHCCPPWTKYSDILCEIPVLDLKSDKIKHSGVDCASESWPNSLSQCSWHAQIVFSLPLSFSSCHPVACRDSSEEFLAARLH